MDPSDAELAITAARAGAAVVRSLYGQSLASADPVAAEVFWTDGEAAWIRRGGTDERLRPVGAVPAGGPQHRRAAAGLR